MPTALITGANRGIGLALAACYAAVPGARVIAVTRDAGRPDALTALVDRSNGRVRAVQADIRDAAAIGRLAQEVGDFPIDLLINNAGVADGSEFGQISAQDLHEVFDVNCFAPLLVTQALRAKFPRGGKIVNVSSILGSLEAGYERVDAFSYAMSKAALNMFTVQLAHLLLPLGIPVLAVHPGGVRTRLGGSGAPLSAEASARGILRVIDALDIEHSGAFLAFDGSEIPF